MAVKGLDNIKRCGMIDTTMKDRKQTLVEAFRKGTREHTRETSRWSHEKQSVVMEPYSYPIPGSKFTIDENFGKKEICIRCKKVWTEDLMTVAKKVANEFGAKVSGYLSVSGFGTAYNSFIIKLA